MITGIAALVGGIGVMLGSGVVLSTALAWMNTFEYDLTKKKSAGKGRPGNHSKAHEGRNRMAGNRPSSLDMFE